MPLAAMQVILGFLRDGDLPLADYQQAIANFFSSVETDRLRALVEDLMLLARGESHFTLSLETIDLALLLSDVTESLQPLAQVKGLELNL